MNTQKGFSVVELVVGLGLSSLLAIGAIVGAISVSKGAQQASDSAIYANNTVKAISQYTLNQASSSRSTLGFVDTEYIDALIASDGDIVINGSAVNIVGNLYSSGDIKINGHPFMDGKRMNDFELLNVDLYKSIAKATGRYIEGDWNLKGNDVYILSNILYVTGDIKMNGKAVIKGNGLIIGKSVTINGNVSVNISDGVK